jgi:hypothetical protein
LRLGGLTFLQQRNTLGELPKHVFEGVYPGKNDPASIGEIGSGG